MATTCIPNQCPVNLTLNVTKSGTGSGTVTSNPAGINCGTDCSESYASGTSVTLTASPAAGSIFAGWSGACTGTGACKVGMTQARSVTAAFTAQTPPPGGTLGEAVDNTGLLWKTGGNAGWFRQKTESYRGGDAAQSGNTSHSQSTWMQTKVIGPGTLSFYWKVSSESKYDSLRFYVDGVEQPGSISGEIDWQRKTSNIPTGTYIIKWAYTKDASADSGSDAGWVDDVRFIAGGALGNAVDNSSLIWRTGGDAAWFRQKAESHRGGDAAQSGDISHGERSWMQTKVIGPGTLSFRWKVSSESKHDFLKFYVDGVKQPGSISGEVDWRRKSCKIPAGNHTVKWVYAKDASRSSGSDAGWVDDVRFSADDADFNPALYEDRLSLDEQVDP